jgi:hypothetical protein
VTALPPLPGRPSALPHRPAVSDPHLERPGEGQAEQRPSPPPRAGAPLLHDGRGAAPARRHLGDRAAASLRRRRGPLLLRGRLPLRPWRGPPRPHQRPGRGDRAGAAARCRGQAFDAEAAPAGTRMLPGESAPAGEPLGHPGERPPAPVRRALRGLQGRGRGLALLVLGGEPPGGRERGLALPGLGAGGAGGPGPRLAELLPVEAARDRDLPRALLELHRQARRHVQVIHGLEQSRAAGLPGPPAGARRRPGLPLLLQRQQPRRERLLGRAAGGVSLLAPAYGDDAPPGAPPGAAHDAAHDAGDGTAAALTESPGPAPEAAQALGRPQEDDEEAADAAAPGAAVLLRPETRARATEER